MAGEVRLAGFALGVLLLDAPNLSLGSPKTTYPMCVLPALGFT